MINMSEFKVDLTNCDREPIHIPGQVQSHGFIVVLDYKNIITYHSSNIEKFITGIEKHLLEKPLLYLESFFDEPYKVDHISELILSNKDNKTFARINPISIKISGANYNLIISTSANNYLLEFEDASATIQPHIQNSIGHSIAEMLSQKDKQELLFKTAFEVKNIIQYDRVMIYRFADDGHGEVVAEWKNEDLTSWLGLHYPASDIPKQARELYKLNLTRIIADVGSISSPIITTAGNNEPLDLTNAQLRAVSPIHIQYLKNMKVASSFSISIIVNNLLWGLIACHNYSPRFIDYRSREYAKLIGQILSSALEFKEEENSQAVQDNFKDNLDKLQRALQENNTVHDALLNQPEYILNTVHATGAIFIYNKNRTLIGIVPEDKNLDGLITWIKENVHTSVYHTASLSSLLPEASKYKDVASGMMVCVLSKENQEFIVWFKREQIQNVKWAGNPDKPADQQTIGLLQISPRNSFEVWSQTVSGRSEEWSNAEINSVIRFKEDITYAFNMKAGALKKLNERLQQAYEELETFSYTISHDLKNPIASIKSFAQLLMRDQSLEMKGHKMLLGIAERANQMNLMINAVLDYSRLGKSDIHYVEVDTSAMIDDIINELKSVYNYLNLNIVVGDTPKLSGDPVMIRQVFSNILSNAVKYAQRSDPAEVFINGTEDETEVFYSIQDNGLGIAAKNHHKIFELFNRMDNVKDIEGSGIGLAIVKRIMQKHKGRIWLESELDNGSTFYIAFRKLSCHNTYQSKDQNI